MAHPLEDDKCILTMRGFRDHYIGRQLPEEVACIEKHAEDRPSFTQPSDIVPIDERDERVARARKVRKAARLLTNNPKWKFTAVQYSAVLAMPLHNLRSVTSTFGGVSVFAGETVLRIPEIIKYFLMGQRNLKNMLYDLDGNGGSRFSKRKRPASRASSKRKKRPDARRRDSYDGPENNNRSNEDDEDNEDNEGDDGACTPKKYRHCSKPQDRDEEQKCHDRDGHKCIIIGGINPDACHIIPFAWSKDNYAIALTACYIKVLESLVPFGDDANPPFPLGDALASEIGASDKVWNMIDLSPTLHRWWS